MRVSTVSAETEVAAWADPETARAFERLIAEEPPPARAFDASGLVRLSQVAPERVDWLWPGRIPFGKLTVLEGDPKGGKSTLALDIAARLSTGAPMPDGHRLAGPAVTVVMSAEDGLADTIRPRLDAAHADVTRVFAWDHELVTDDDGVQTGIRPPSLPRDVARLVNIVEELDARLVIVDVLNAFLGADVDGHRDQDIRRALTPLKMAAEQTGAAIMAIRHLNKGSGPAIYRGGGSIGIAGAARSILVAAVDPEDETGERRVLAVTGANLAAPAPSLAYRLTSDDERGCARIDWLGVSGHTSATLLAQPVGDDDRTAVGEAEAFLRDLLGGGPVAAKEVERGARDAGVQSRTLRRAKERMGVRSLKVGFGSSWAWSLPAEDDHGVSQGGQTPELGHLGHLRSDQGFSGSKGGHSPKGGQGAGFGHLRQIETFDDGTPVPDASLFADDDDEEF